MDLLRGLLRRSRRPHVTGGPALADDGALVVVGSSFDPARADSAVVGEMADAGVDLSRPLLLRHHMWLPGEAVVGELRQIVGQDGYAVRVEKTDDGFRVRVSRPQQITGLAIAQERSRMAGLAERLGGDADGWDVMAPR